jgi:hypothetical protein
LYVINIKLDQKSTVPQDVAQVVAVDPQDVLLAVVLGVPLVDLVQDVCLLGVVPQDVLFVVPQDVLFVVPQATLLRFK